MKAFYIPVGLLALILGFSLWTGRYVELRTQHWTALLEETPDQSLEVLLEHLGKALNGERTYIFERNETGGDDNTYEWVAHGVQPEKDNLQNVPPEVCAFWYKSFRIGKHIVIKDLEDTRENDPLCTRS